MVEHGGNVYGYNKKLIDFSSNISPLGLQPELKKAIEESIPDVVRYPDPDCRALREAVAKRENVLPSQVICGSGAADIIFQSVLAERPKRALLAAPCFSEYEQALKAFGTDIVFYQMKEENGWRLLDDYLDYIVPETGMLFLCNPNNPTGITINDNLLDMILERAYKSGVRVVLDECFCDFLDCPEKHSKYRYLSKYPNMMILKSFTKMYSLPGLRIGYGLCSDSGFIKRIESVRQPWSVSGPAQAAGIAAAGMAGIPAKTRAAVSKERDFLCRALRSLNIKYTKPEANYVFFHSRCGLKEWLLTYGFLIRDCSNYTGLDTGYYRIAVRKHDENAVFVRALKKIWRDEPWQNL